ncbi:MAG: hypothetical protein AABW59_03600 [archaeon]
MELKEWRLAFKLKWDRYFSRFDKQTQRQILKKLEHMKQPLLARGLHSSNFQVEEIGQYRIAFYQNDENHTKEIHFVGNHKQYEKWYKKS